MVTNESFRREKLDESGKEFFFRTGEEYIEKVFETIHTQLDKGFVASRALDFGCGVGRLVLPLARHCAQVVGVDVSESMLAEARANVEEREVGNVDLIRGDDSLSEIPGDFDLINSYIVLQHIPVERGIQLFHRLVNLLRDGGVGVLHVTYSDPPQTHALSGRIMRSLKNGLRNLARGGYSRVRKALLGKTPDSEDRSNPVSAILPQMQMNPYDLHTIFHILQRAGVEHMHVEFTDHSGSFGTILFFQKPKKSGQVENNLR